MSRTVTLSLLFWNIVLSILVGYILTQGRSPARIAEADGEPDIETTEKSTDVFPLRDSIAMKDARIAFFFMDSVQQHYTLVKESADKVRSEAKRLEADLGREMQKARARAQELAEKDHTYSTQAQIQADQQEFQSLELKLQEMNERSQMKMEEMQMRMLGEISKEIEDFLEEHNTGAGFDFIFSIQEGGQIWVGNENLDITAEVLSGLNERHKAKQRTSVIE